MDPKELVQLNVVLLPKGEVELRANQWSAELAECGTEFTLGVGCFAHLSLYQAAYPRRSHIRVQEMVRNIAKRTQPFQVTMNGFGIFWQTFVFWDADRSEDLRRLHHRLLEALNPLREDRLLPIHEQLLNDPTIPAELRDSIRQYGNPLCGDQERPHITLTRLRDSQNADRALACLGVQADSPITDESASEQLPPDRLAAAVKTLKRLSSLKHRTRPTEFDMRMGKIAAGAPWTGVVMRFEVTLLHMTEVGPHGTCPRILESVPLR